MKQRQKFNSLCKKCKKPLIRFRIGDNVQTINGELRGIVINYEIPDMIFIKVENQEHQHWKVRQNNLVMLK